MLVLDSIFSQSATTDDYLFAYRERFVELVQAVEIGSLAKVVDAIEERAASGACVYVFGNGGSSAVASHWVNDLGVNTLVEGVPGVNVHCLSDNAPTITAVANDLCFEEVFAAQLRCVLNPNDLVIALSVSGNSPNIIRAVEQATLIGATTVGFCGMSGGKLGDLVDLAVHTPSGLDEYGLIEDVFSVCMHNIAGLIAMRRGRTLHH